MLVKTFFSQLKHHTMKIQVQTESPVQPDFDLHRPKYTKSRNTRYIYSFFFLYLQTSSKLGEKMRTSLPVISQLVLIFTLKIQKKS